MTFKYNFFEISKGSKINLQSPGPGITWARSCLVLKCWPRKKEFSTHFFNAKTCRLELEARIKVYHAAKKKAQNDECFILIQFLTFKIVQKETKQFSSHDMLSLFSVVFYSVWINLGLINLLENLLTQGKHTRRMQGQNFMVTYGQLHFENTC